MDDLKARKVVLQEPRHSGGDKSVFENVMEEFYSAIKGESLEEGQDGAIMFAVCRGKISEGLDFADDNARAVITVGIPFPNYNDEQVKIGKRREFGDNFGKFHVCWTGENEANIQRRKRQARSVERIELVRHSSIPSAEPRSEMLLKFLGNCSLDAFFCSTGPMSPSQE
jgi:fanconi anemia group J protein